MCTGTFAEQQTKMPPWGEVCAYPCVNDSGRWGKSYCYTNKEKTLWGAECVPCGNWWFLH